MKDKTYILLDKNEIKEKYSFVKNELDPYEVGFPLLDLSDETICKIYYFRWHTFVKHIRKTPIGHVVTEFFPDVPWAGKYNTINCPASHHFYEGRWLYDYGYLESYARFWLSGEADVRKYSFPIVDAYYEFCKVKGDFSLCFELYDLLKENYSKWEEEKKQENGLFYQRDGRDGMEYSISGHGLRPTINSYMYADSIALSKIAKMLGKADDEAYYMSKAEELKRLIDENLWDSEACFYKNLSEDLGYKKADVREEIGYVPWCYNIPDEDKGEAWKFLMDEDYFAAPCGITSAERNHPRFMEKFDHECLWNGPSWPFATSQTLTALANLLTNYGQNIMTKHDYFVLLKQYANQHFITENGEKIPFIDEDLDPFTGEWIAKRELEKMQDPPGGADRGKDYNHSSFCDLVISGLCGIRTRADGFLEIDPLFCENDLGWLCADGIKYRGHFISILWDRDGEHYGLGKGFAVFVDGDKKATSDKIEKISIKL